MSEYLYILFDEPNQNLIIGTTSNLLMHMHEIKNKTNDIYENEYNTNKLAYYEKFDELAQVIIRENELKNLSTLFYRFDKGQLNILLDHKGNL